MNRLGFAFSLYDEDQVDNPNCDGGSECVVVEPFTTKPPEHTTVAGMSCDAPEENLINDRSLATA